jgi:hypothetical protein
MEKGNKEYFMLDQDRRYGFAPVILNLLDVLNVSFINRDDAHRLPEHSVLYVRNTEAYDRPDVLNENVFLVSKGVERVFSFYDKDIVFKNVALIAEKASEQMPYSLPILEDADCLHGDSEYGYGSLRKIVLDREKVGRRSVFRIRDEHMQCVTVVRLDVAESLLRRGFKGLSFTELEVR